MKKLILAFSLISGNALSDTLRVPLLAECHETAKYFLEKHGPRLNVSAELQKFDVQLESHPNVVGVLTLRGADTPRNELVAIVNTIQHACYPINRTVVSKSDPQFAEKLKKTLDLNVHLGIQHTYLIDTKDAVEVHYNLGKEKLR